MSVWHSARHICSKNVCCYQSTTLLLWHILGHNKINGIMAFTALFIHYSWWNFKGSLSPWWALGRKWHICISSQSDDFKEMKNLIHFSFFSYKLYSILNFNHTHYHVTFSEWLSLLSFSSLLAPESQSHDILIATYF